MMAAARKFPNDARLWAYIVGEFRDAGADSHDALIHGRRAVAFVRRERAKTPARTFAPGDEIPLSVTRAYDLDGAVWERQATDPGDTLRDTWKMPGFDPGKHEPACEGAWITPWLLDQYGPLTEVTHA
jgi:hypothetical protein